MANYSGINYEMNENCFKKMEYVTSSFLYGDLDYIQEPWLTVLIPTYKRADLLFESLQSALTQWHTDFPWDIVVLDNEKYDGVPNLTEKLIRKTDNKKVLYYRNSENMRPGDNFNRGFLLARGKWVCMLHDDDLLVANALQTLGKLIGFFSKKSGKPLGAISATYYQFEYDAKSEAVKADIPGINSYLSSLPTQYPLYRLTHSNVLATGHIGGCVPSNGSTFLREAVIKKGGFNDDFGISADLILFYCLENDYSLYMTTSPLGFYRWGSNTMIKAESTHNTIEAGYDFREYVYSKNFFTRLIGELFRKLHYQHFTMDVITEKKKVSNVKIELSDFDGIFPGRPGKFIYYFYTHFFLRAYSLHKKCQSKQLIKGVRKYEYEYYC